MNQKPSVIQETNYLLRTVVYGAIVSIVGFVGWEARDFLEAGDASLQKKQQELEELEKQVEKIQIQHTKDMEARDEAHRQTLAELRKSHQQAVDKLNRELARINTALRFLKLDHRVARIEVLDQQVDPQDPEKVQTSLRFTELGSKGEPLGLPTVGTIKGRELYIDALTIQFKDEFVEQGDLLRGQSICRFRRLFGERQPPNEGISLDRPPTSPGDMTDFERELWDKFWDLANDPEHAEQRGIKTVGGGGPSIVTKKGMTYRVELRASGGLSIKPDAEPESKPASPVEPK